MTHERLTILPATIPGDLDACAEIYAAGQREIFPGQPGSWTRDRFAEATAGEEISVAVADDAGGRAVVGFLSLWRPDAFVHFLHVRADHRRRGVGRALLRSALATLDAPAELKCALENRAALAFYTRLGWVETGREVTGPEPFVRLRSPPATAATPPPPYRNWR